MAIKTTSPHDQLSVDNIILYLYGLPSMWKTSIGMTAENAVLINFDRGAHRVNATLRRSTVLDIDNWSDIQNLQQSVIAPFKTVIIDTAGTMQDCARQFVAEDRKNTHNGVLKQNAQGTANSYVNAFIKKLKSWRKDIIFIAHAIEDKNNQDRNIIRPDVGGRLRQDLYRQADCMGLLMFEQRPNCLQRIIHFTANDEFLAKDCADLHVVDVPDLFQVPTFLGNLIQFIKNKINTLTPEQAALMKAKQEAALWENQCSEARTAKDFNELTQDLAVRKQQGNPQHNLMGKVLMAYAVNLGFVFDKEKNQWLESA